MAKVKTVVDLIPWDPDSPQHVQRMFDQRVECGWKSDFVEKWRAKQREGTMALQWVVLKPEDPNTEARLAQHLAKYPQEATPLSDTCALFGGQARTPALPPRSFVPMGHLSLDSLSEVFPQNADASRGIYSITSLYVSDALQSGGVGNAAMDAIESVARGSPLFATTITLDCLAKEKSKDRAFYAARGMEMPKVAVQEWYERRGFEVYGRIENGYLHVDPSLKGYDVSAMLMRKILVD